ncbi:MAG: hypothetical protein ACYSUI_04270 [Planctomycetota bacterium]
MPRASWYVLLAAAGGCGPAAWRPALERVRPGAPNTAIDLTPHLQPSIEGSAVYARWSLSDQDEPPQLYERRPGAGTLTEGAMAAKRITTVAEYLEPTAKARYRRGALWPEDPKRSGAAFFLEFDPPLVYLPASIDVDTTFQQRGRMRYHNRDAAGLREGTVSREVTFEGFETVHAGGIEYPDCARLRIECRYRLRWGPRVNTTEYVWLARGIGEVSRVERVSGLAWLVYFTEAYAYELIEPPLLQPSSTGESQPQVQAWSRCAVFLDRVLPHPRLGGLAVELAPSTAPNTVARATRARRSVSARQSH